MEKRRRIFAFVFARGGSKGLVNKNILPIGGIPLVGRSINIAKKLEVIEEVFVSTDSEEIAEVGANYGAEIIQRPANLSQDNSPEWEAWRHAISKVKDKFGSFDIFISLPTTAPLRRSEDVSICLNEFINIRSITDILITVMPSKKSPWFNMVKVEENGYTTLLNQGQNYSCRQQVPKSFEISPLAYVTTPSYIEKGSSMWSGKVKSLEFPYERALDIDDRLDYELACRLWDKNRKNYE